MTTDERKQARNIGNVGILDIRNATPEAMQTVAHIGNVGTILFSRETADLLAQLDIENIGSSLEVPDETQIVSGQFTVHRDTFKHQATPLGLLVSGQMMIHSDVQVDDIAEGLGSLYVSGQLICPEHLVGAVQSKLKDISGQTVVYDAEAELIMGTLRLDNAYLTALDDQSSLVVLGRLDMFELVDEELLTRKIRLLQVLGSIRCREENLAAIQPRLKGGRAKTKVIPAGYQLIDRSVRLDSMLLNALAARNLYSTHSIQISEDVTPELLDSQVDSLMSEYMIVSPSLLGSVLAQKCDLLSSRVILYDGTLRVIAGEEKLRAESFEFIDDKVTLVVTGELTIDPGVEPNVLADRVAQIANFGEIICYPKHMGAIQARLTVDEGEIIDLESETSIGNIGRLTL